MWSPLRRAPRGRHALGAAVTALPSGPVGAPDLTVAAATAPSLLPGSAAFPALGVNPAPAAPSLSQPAPSAGGVQDSARRQGGPVLPGIIEELLALAAELDALTLGELSSAPPGQRPGPVEPDPTTGAHDGRTSASDGPLVELGFADGSYRTLDPSSPSARALGDLVGELTRGVCEPARPGSGRA